MRMHINAARSSRRIATTAINGYHIWHYQQGSNAAWVVTERDPNDGINREHLRYSTRYATHRAACMAARDMLDMSEGD